MNWTNEIEYHSNTFESSIPKFQGLGYQGLGFESLGFEVLGGLGSFELKSLGGLKSSPWSRILLSWIRDPVSEARGLRASRALAFLGFDLGLWAIGLDES